MRLFRVLALVCALPLVSSAAHAQASVYGGISLANYGYNQNPTNNPSNFIFKSDTVGITGGATYLFPSSHITRVGIDAHFDGSPGDRGGNAGLFSARVAFVPQSHSVRPYFQVGGGYTSTKVGSTNYSGATFGFGGGLDIQFHNHVFIRPIEIIGEAGNKSAHANYNFAVGYQFSGYHHS